MIFLMLWLAPKNEILVIYVFRGLRIMRSKVPEYNDYKF